jgi:hypothetical protein
MRVPLLAIVVTLLAVAPASAQIDECAAYGEGIQRVVDGAANAAAELVDVSRAPRCMVLFMAGLNQSSGSRFRDFIKRFESFRSDKQTTASPSGGATSVVAGGPVARVLSVATEYGALTQSVNGQVVTVRGNLAGVPAVLVKKNVFPYCVAEDASRGFCVDGSALGILKRFSFAVSFDPSRIEEVTATATSAAKTTPKEVTITGKSREISAASLRVELWNRRDASSANFMKAWKEKVGPAMNPPANELAEATNFIGPILLMPEYRAWRETSRQAVEAAGRDRDAVTAALVASLDKLAVLMRGVPNANQLITDAANAYSRFFLAQDELINDLAVKNVLAFEYTNNRPVGQPAMSNYRVIFDLPFNKGKTKVIVNAAFTFYNTVPDDQTEIGRYRDAQVGTQIDHALGKVAIIGPAVVSGAAYFQYQSAPALLKVDPLKPLPGVTFVDLPEDAKDVFVPKGNIILFQGKLSLVPEGSSVKIPVSVTWSNRTELIDKPVFRGQVGVSYDLDGVFAGLRQSASELLGSR